MLKITPDPTFKVPVQITVPGQAKPETLTVTFKYLSRESALAFFTDAAKNKTSDLDCLKDIMVEWEGFDGPFPFNEENLKTLLDNYPASGFDLLTGYRKNLFESRIKN
jgi:hypothetical protein